MQIQRNQFVMNKRKGFYCARILVNNEHKIHSYTNSSTTSWRLTTNKIKKNINKTVGRHSSIRCLNNKGRTHPKVDNQVISKLRQFYAPFNKHFERMVNMKFNWPEL